MERHSQRLRLLTGRRWTLQIREALLTHTNAEYTEKASNSDVCSNFLIEK
jgi:hypothetical protein